MILLGWVLVAFPAGLVGTWMVRALARKLSIVNQPNPIVPQHTKPTPYLGGVGLALGFYGTFCLGAAAWWEIPYAFASFDVLGALFLGLPAILALGVLDDVVALRPSRKFLGQVLVAVALVVLGLQMRITGLGWVDGGLTTLWLVTMINAVNLTDVCDGLVAGLAVVWGVAMWFLLPQFGLVFGALTGASLGFLFFNAPPASIFLGDAGSHFLGLLMGLGGVWLVNDHGLWPGGASALLVAGVPLFELIFLVGVRLSKKIPWWRGSPDHFSLRLQAAGFSRWHTDLLAWSAGIVLAGAAVALLREPVVGAVPICVGACGAVSWTAWQLLRMEHPTG